MKGCQHTPRPLICNSCLRDFCTRCARKGHAGKKACLSNKLPSYVRVRRTRDHITTRNIEGARRKLL